MLALCMQLVFVFNRVKLDSDQIPGPAIHTERISQIKLFLVLFNLQGWNVILDEKSMMIKRSTDQHQTNDEKI